MATGNCTIELKFLQILQSLARFGQCRQIENIICELSQYFCFHFWTSV